MFGKSRTDVSDLIPIILCLLGILLLTMGLGMLIGSGYSLMFQPFHYLIPTGVALAVLGFIVQAYRRKRQKQVNAS